MQENFKKKSTEQEEQKELIFLKQSEIKTFRGDLLEKQNGICPILKIKLNLDDAVLDHHHAIKSIPLGEIVPCGKNGNGCIRATIHKFANVLEGKVYNSYIRTGLSKSGISLPEILRNLADYLENPPAPAGIVHPSEAPKESKIGKRIFNAINKAYQQEYPNRKPLTFPKSGKWTKKLKTLAKRYNLDKS